VFDDHPDSGGTTTSDTSTPGDDSTTPTDDSTAVDSTPATDTGVAMDTGKPDTGPTPTTLENVCDRLADAVCTKSFQTCCGSKGITYDEGGCRTAITTGCSDRVDSVMAGDATFDASAFPACAAAWNALATKCSIPILDYVKGYAPCQQLFNGKTAPNDTCTQDEDCHAATGQWVRCATDGSSVCNAFSVPGKDKACGYSSGTAAICDYGLACNYTSMTMGTCKSAKMTGASCNQDYECGFGNYCAKSPFSGGPGSCQVGLPYMSGCSANNQCASGRCSSGSCSDPNVTLASDAICNGG
jgi:hypothetical protein